MDARINIITLGVADLSISRNFYEKGLGWKVSAASQESILFFQLGAIVLALYPREGLAKDAHMDPAGSGFRGVTLAYNTREKTEVAKVLEIARQAGAKIVKPAQDVFWGGHSGYFADPDGHLWEIAWNPHISFNDRGELVLD